jgi:two-component system, chemotaxis family, CheB/CheR fusion protein
MSSSDSKRLVEPDTVSAGGTSDEFEALLLDLKQSRGFDFTAYKRSGLMRRVLMRIQSVGISKFSEYQNYLQADPQEFTRLFNTILINVTAFFRDPATWQHFSEHVLADLVGREGATHPIRVWSAGCASGEEAFTIAMLLADRLGPGQFRERVKIFATDVDEEALNQARLAVYTSRGVEGVPLDLLAKYFDQEDGRYAFNKELRRSVIFGRHDLIQDGPISRVNLLVCRNCLMYFNAEAQARILERFHFALVDGGVLFLGKAETLQAPRTMFGASDEKRRFFTKTRRTQPGGRPIP